MEPIEDTTLGKSKIKSGFSANTAEGLTIFGQKEIDLQLTLCLEHTSGDLFHIVGIIFPRPTGPRPQLSAIVLERLSDKVQGKRSVTQVRELIEAGTMIYKPLRNDARAYRKVEVTKDELIVWVTDTPETIEIIHIPEDQLETL